MLENWGGFAEQTLLGLLCGSWAGAESNVNLLPRAQGR